MNPLQTGEKFMKQRLALQIGLCIWEFSAWYNNKVKNGVNALQYKSTSILQMG